MEPNKISTMLRFFVIMGVAIVSILKISYLAISKGFRALFKLDFNRSFRLVTSHSYFPIYSFFILALFAGWISYFAVEFLFSNSKHAVASTSQNSANVGGVGVILPDSSDLGDLQDIVEDEKWKDKLLGIDTSEKKKEIVQVVEKKLSSTHPQKLQKISYKIKPGDTLGSIAKKFRVSVESIAGSSSIRILDDIRVGQRLAIPTKEGFFFKIKKGDRLASVLQRYHITYEKFLSFNVNINPDLLEIGDDIFLPGAKPKNIIRGWFIPVTSRVITSGYGWRTYPRRTFHKGLDLRAIYAPIRAARTGIVTFAGWLGGYGNAIVLTHNNGYKTLYAHLSRIYIRRGQKIRQGRVMGRSGNTGFSFGPHLHFEVSYRGRTISPHRILKGLRYRR